MSRNLLLMGSLLAASLLVAGCPNGANVGDANNPKPGTAGTASGSVSPEAMGGLNLAYGDMPANSWTVGSPMAHERVGLSVGVLDNKLYAVGGDGEASLELYDPLRDSWQLVPLAVSADPYSPASPANRSRYFGAVVTSGDRLFYVGGTSDFLLPFMEVYDPRTYQWLDLWSPYFTSWRFARMAHAAVNVNGVVYVIGGLSSVNGSLVPIGDVYAVSTIADENYLKAPLPTPRAGLGAAVLGDRIYVAGGYGTRGGPDTPVATDSMLCYMAGEWIDTAPSGAKLAPLKVARHSFGSAVLNGKWYVAGGMDAAGQPLGSVEEYDPSTNTWTLKAAMPTARVHLALGAIGNRLFAMGGYDAQNRQLRSVDVFRP